jgi:hypothetical protein
MTVGTGVGTGVGGRVDTGAGEIVPLILVVDSVALAGGFVITGAVFDTRNPSESWATKTVSTETTITATTI